MSLHFVVFRISEFLILQVALCYLFGTYLTLGFITPFVAMCYLLYLNRNGLIGVHSITFIAMLLMLWTIDSYTYGYYLHDTLNNGYCVLNNGSHSCFQGKAKLYGSHDRDVEIWLDSPISKYMHSVWNKILMGDKNLTMFKEL
jgi:hypothetical protein